MTLAIEFFVETAPIVRKRVYGGVDVYGTLACHPFVIVNENETRHVGRN